MEIKCDYCGNMIPDNSPNCPHCGAVNNNMKRTADGTPKTIEELKQWYAARNLPPSTVTRFFIGEDFKGARAFGIYEENGEYIVYKNKDDGSRAIRYQGKDQAYAVNEIYLKLKSEILHQASRNTNEGQRGTYRKKRTSGKLYTFLYALMALFVIASMDTVPHIIIPVIVVSVIAIVVFNILASKFESVNNIKRAMMKVPKIVYVLIACVILCFIGVKGIDYTTPSYYSYNDDVYCRYEGDYYKYNGTEYIPVYGYSLYDSIDEYGTIYSYDDGSSTWWSDDYSFEDSDYYDEDDYSYSSGSSYDSDYSWGDSSWDSGYDWDSGSSWDSFDSGSDWGSDW